MFLTVETSIGIDISAQGRRNVSKIKGAEKIFNFRASRLPETAISRVFVKKKYSTSEKIFN